MELLWLCTAVVYSSSLFGLGFYSCSCVYCIYTVVWDLFFDFHETWTTLLLRLAMTIFCSWFCWCGSKFDAITSAVMSQLQSQPLSSIMFHSERDSTVAFSLHLNLYWKSIKFISWAADVDYLPLTIMFIHSFICVQDNWNSCLWTWVKFSGVRDVGPT